MLLRLSPKKSYSVIQRQTSESGQRAAGNHGGSNRFLQRNDIKRGFFIQFRPGEMLDIAQKLHGKGIFVISKSIF
jgi:hypothetical protein